MLRVDIFQSSRLWAAVALVTLLSLTANAQAVVVTTVDGQTVNGDLADWTAAEVTVTTNGEAKNFSAQELLELRLQELPASAPEFRPFVELLDGTRLPISEFSVIERVASVVTSLSAEPLKIPAEKIRMVQFASNEAADSWLGPNLAGDFIVVTKKESSETETLEGIINGVTSEQVDFTWDGDAIPVKRSKITALGFYHAGPEEVAEPACWLSLSSGARLLVSNLRREAEELQLTTSTGLNLNVPLQELVSADYSVGKLIYLSDLEFLKSDWMPLVAYPAAVESIQSYGKPRRNISFGGSPLSLSWPRGENGAGNTLQTYNKGLALRSRTELEYRLPKSMRRFVAIAGIDPESLSQGNVLLTIEIDGQTAFEQIIDGKQPPTNVDLDITGKQRLKITVDYGENLDFGDRLHLVEARLIK
jgi:hypothetical protein